MALTELIYVSSMAGNSEHTLAAILESSVRRNRENNITGMLLFCRGGFMQVLEGEEAQVRETFARICADRRHHDIVTLTTGEIPERHFSGWSMGFKHISESAQALFPRYMPYFDFGRQAHAIQGIPGLALEMLTLFSQEK